MDNKSKAQDQKQLEDEKDEVIELETIEKGTDEVEEVLDSSSIMITFSAALKLKQNLFEIFKASDADNNNLIDFNEFKNALRKYIPNLTNEIKIRGMFNALDANQDSNISYDEFLSDKNFHAFLKFCGYIVHRKSPPTHYFSMSDISERHHMSSESKQTEHYTNQFRKQITQQIMDEDINIRLQYKEDEISELQSWIIHTGQPAIKKLEKTQLNLEKVEQELSYIQQENNVLNDQISLLKDDKSILSLEISEYQSSTKLMVNNFSNREMLQELKLEETLLENADAHQNKFQVLKEKYHQLQNEHKNIQNSNSNLNELNLKYVETNHQLSEDIKAKKELVSVERNEKLQLNEIIDQMNRDLIKVGEEMNELRKSNARKIEEIKQFSKNTLPEEMHLSLMKTMDFGSMDSFGLKNMEMGSHPSESDVFYSPSDPMFINRNNISLNVTSFSLFSDDRSFAVRSTDIYSTISMNKEIEMKSMQEDNQRLQYIISEEKIKHQKELAVIRSDLEQEIGKEFEMKYQMEGEDRERMDAVQTNLTDFSVNDEENHATVESEALLGPKRRPSNNEDDAFISDVRVRDRSCVCFGFGLF